MWTQLKWQCGSGGLGLRCLRQGLISRWKEGTGDVYAGDYNDGLQNKDGKDHITLVSAIFSDGMARALSDREERGLLRYVNGTQGEEEDGLPAQERRPKRRSCCQQRQGQQQRP